MGNESTLKAGDYAILLAEPWNRYVFQCQPFLRDKLEEMIWWGYRIESVNGNRAVIQSLSAPNPTRETVPIECLTGVKKGKDDRVKVKRPIVTPHPVGAKVLYLENRYAIESVEWDEAWGEPVYNLKTIEDQKLVWGGDRAWHNLIDLID